MEHKEDALNKEFRFTDCNHLQTYLIHDIVNMIESYLINRQYDLVKQEYLENFYWNDAYASSEHPYPSLLGIKWYDIRYNWREINYRLHEYGRDSFRNLPIFHCQYLSGLVRKVGCNLPYAY